MEYTSRGMEPFTYKMKGKMMTIAYHEVPPDVLENAPELVAGAPGHQSRRRQEIHQAREEGLSHAPESRVTVFDACASRQTPNQSLS